MTLYERRISVFLTENIFLYSVYFFSSDSAVFTLYICTVKEDFTVLTQSIMYTVDVSLIFSVKLTEN